MARGKNIRKTYIRTEIRIKRKSAHKYPSSGQRVKKKWHKLPNLTGTLTNIITSLAIFKIIAIK